MDEDSAMERLEVEIDAVILQAKLPVEDVIAVLSIMLDRYKALVERDG